MTGDRVYGHDGAFRRFLEDHRQAYLLAVQAKCGLDAYEVHSWTGWHRHVSLNLFALAVVAAIRVTDGAGPQPKTAARGASG